VVYHGWPESGPDSAEDLYKNEPVPMQFIYRTRDKVWDFYEVSILIGAFDTVQGLTKVPSGRPTQVDFPNGLVTFHTHLPDGQGPRQVTCQLNFKKSKLSLAQGKQNLRAACSKGKLEFKFF